MVDDLTCNVAELQATKWDLHCEGTFLPLSLRLIMIINNDDDYGDATIYFV